MTQSAAVVHSCVIKRYRHVCSSLPSDSRLRALSPFSKRCRPGVHSPEPQRVLELRKSDHQLQAAALPSPPSPLSHGLMPLLLVQVLGT